MLFEKLPKPERLIMLILYAAKECGYQNGAMTQDQVKRIILAIDGLEKTDDEIEGLRRSLINNENNCKILLYEERIP